MWVLDHADLVLCGTESHNIIHSEKRLGYVWKSNLKKNQLLFSAILPLSNILFLKTRLLFVWLQIRHEQGPNNRDDVTCRICDVATSQITPHSGGCFSQTKFFITLISGMKGDFCLEWMSLVKKEEKKKKKKPASASKKEEKKWEEAKNIPKNPCLSQSSSKLKNSFS